MRNCVRTGIAELSLGFFLDVDVEVKVEVEAETETVCPVDSGDCVLLSTLFLLAFERVAFFLRLACRLGSLGWGGEGAGEL